MREIISEVVKKYEYCPKYKVMYRQYGHVPPKNVNDLNPCEVVYVDMIGPWRAIINNFEYQFTAVIIKYIVVFTTQCVGWIL